MQNPNSRYNSIIPGDVLHSHNYSYVCGNTIEFNTVTMFNMILHFNLK